MQSKVEEGDKKKVQRREKIQEKREDEVMLTNNERYEIMITRGTNSNIGVCTYQQNLRHQGPGTGRWLPC